ncbi:MAG: methanol dehydrogenase [Caulobacter sp.]|nr:methanol dehydrogenase [Caulobacter sp.]
MLGRRRDGGGDGAPSRPLHHSGPAFGERGRGWVVALLTLIAVAVAAPTWAAPTFPPLTGRVVDNANILSPQAETALTAKLATLEQTTGRQLVVATLPSLQGYEIEDYGYQLGRAWKIGEKGKNSGALLIVAPSEKAVRIEVGYGLEPVLTDALSSVIIQTTVLPRFRAGDLEGGVVAGADALVDQLSLPDDQARARVAKAAEPRPEAAPSFPPMAAIFIGLFVLFLISRLLSGRRRGGLGGALPWIILSALSNGGGRGGGGFSGGGGGFSGGGGSFGGGGASGRW